MAAASGPYEHCPLPSRCLAKRLGELALLESVEEMFDCDQQEYVEKKSFWLPDPRHPAGVLFFAGLPPHIPPESYRPLNEFSLFEDTVRLACEELAQHASDDVRSSALYKQVAACLQERL